MAWEVTVLCANGDCYNQWSDRDAETRSKAYEAASDQGWEIGPDMGIVCPWCVQRKSKPSTAQANPPASEVSLAAMREIAREEIKAMARRVVDRCSSANTIDDRLEELIEPEAALPF